MATLSKENNKLHQISLADVGLEDIVIAWLFKRFKELPHESHKDIVSLIEILLNPETSEEEYDEISKTMREILFPHLIGTVRMVHADQEEQISDKIQRRKEWVGNTVKKYRTQKGLTQIALARKSGLRQPQISRLEMGVHSPSFKTLEKIANALGVDIGELDPSN